jgi:hypothetical protein
VFHLSVHVEFSPIPWRDISGRCVLWVFGGIMLELAEYVLNIAMHGNVACSVFVIPFQRHA